MLRNTRARRLLSIGLAVASVAAVAPASSAASNGGGPGPTSAASR